MARSAEAFWQLAHYLHADEPLEQGRGVGAGFYATPTGANPDDPAGARRAGQHHHQGASRRHGSLKKSGPQAIGRSRGGCTTKIHLVAANAQCALSLALSPGQAGDAPQERELLRAGGAAPAGCPLIRDRAYEGHETRELALELGCVPVVPPNPNRLVPWEYARVSYRRRNEIERLFRRRKGYRRIFSRFDKLDVLFAGFILFALIVEALC